MNKHIWSEMHAACTAHPGSTHSKAQTQYFVWLIEAVMSLEASVRVGSIYKNEVNLTLVFSVWFSLSLFWSERTAFMAVNQLDYTSLHYTAHACRFLLRLSEQSWLTALPVSLRIQNLCILYYIKHNRRVSPLLHCFGAETQQTKVMVELLSFSGITQVRVNSSHSIQGRQADKTQSKKTLCGCLIIAGLFVEVCWEL